MKKLILLITLLGLTACGEMPELTKDVIEDASIRYYTDMVMQDMPYNAPYLLPRVVLKSDLNKSFCHLAPNEDCDVITIAGVARNTDSGQPIEILLDAELWAIAGDSTRTALVAHEILHSIWGLRHSDSGLMHPYLDVSTFELNEFGLKTALERALGDR